MISIIHPSRSRPKKSIETITKWVSNAIRPNEIELIVSLDTDDPDRGEYIYYYQSEKIVFSDNRSAVEAINNGAKQSIGNFIVVVSDDTDCFQGWDASIEKTVEGKSNFVLKTQDGIQPWIITMPIMDRVYFNRTGYIYDPDFDHMFCDTWLTVQADISGRKLTSNLTFSHLNGSIQDDVKKRSDATWQQGERTFIDKVRKTPIEDLRKIQDVAMKNWIRNKTGIRL